MYFIITIPVRFSDLHIVTGLYSGQMQSYHAVTSATELVPFTPGRSKPFTALSLSKARKLQQYIQAIGYRHPKCLDIMHPDSCPVY